MNYNLLEMMGLQNFDITYLFIGIFVLFLLILILLIIQSIRLSKYSKKYNQFMKGRDVKSLEKEIIGVFEDNRFIKVTLEKHNEEIKNLFKKMRLTYQKLGIVKYDAFNQMGGQLSFCLVLLDERDTGFILNSVHSAEGCYTYTKEIVRGESELPLGNEEREALQQAMGE